MKAIIAIFLLLGCLSVTTVRSQQFASKNIQPVNYGNARFITNHGIERTPDLLITYKHRDKHRDALRFRNGGIILTGVGIATIIVGAIMVSAAGGVIYYHSTTNNGYGQSETDGSFSGAMGAIGIVGGALGTAGGAVMWWKGDQVLRRQQK